MPGELTSMITAKEKRKEGQQFRGDTDRDYQI